MQCYSDLSYSNKIKKILLSRYHKMCNLEETNSERSPPVRSAGKRSEHKEPVRAKKERA